MSEYVVLSDVSGGSDARGFDDPGDGEAVVVVGGPIAGADGRVFDGVGFH
jgi:hypothetical protein